ncbi:S-layer family protein, partial [Mucilaginibacter sp.]|uniref:beta strand repeat-containing protein n=1 Tax=Mucilaginibacter sp. TaxID=1882438 RepID=UPI0026304608
MSQKGILQAILSLKDKVLLSTGINSLRSNSTEFSVLSLDNDFYAEVGVPIINDFPGEKRRLKGFIPKPVVKAITFATRLFAARAVMIFCLLYFISPYAFSQTTQPATVQTDQQDYAPGTTVYITGAGFAANEAVTLQVLHAGTPTGDNQTSQAHLPWTVTADSTGNITATWLVPLDEDEIGATLQLTAVGQTSRTTAQTTFTDAASSNLAITSSPSPGTYGGTITLTATLTKGGGAGIGGEPITFKFNGSGGTTVGTAITSSSGVASITVSLTGNGTSGGTRINANTYANYIYATYTGADGNFQASSNTNNLTVNPLGITAGMTAPNKVYDGTAGSTFTLGALSGVLSGDNVTASGGTATFSDKNVGTGKTVTATVIVSSNANYVITASTTANITKASLTVTATGVNKVYNATTAAIVTLSDNHFGTDVITEAYTSAAFSDKNVANGKTVNVSGISISGGADAGNYTLGNTTAGTTANITKASLTVSATGINKVYDGNTTAAVTLSDNHLGTDVVTEAYTSAAFSDKNVTNGKTVTVSGISISGTDAGNYTFNSSTTTIANITSRTLTATASASNKVYNGTTAAAVILNDDRISGDNLTVHFATSTFSDKNVGTGKIVTITPLSITGPASGNYTLASTTITTTANITQLPLAITATGVNKVYDGTTSATATLSDNRLTGDVFTDSYTTANFADKNVGIGKTVSVSGISITGTGAGNYSFNTTAATTANISVASVTVTADAQTKTYGNTDPSLTYKVTTGAVVSGDSFTGALSRTSGEAVGSYPVGQGTVALGTNYTLSYAGANLDITARPVTITADAKTKVYGDSDPSLTY